jgi:GT2 family glycosyltransferase
MNDHHYDVSIIIVNYNTRELLRQCLASLYETPAKLTFETIVVDNASSDGSAAAVRELFPRVVLVENQVNSGFSRANNIGIRMARGRYLLLLNSDTIVLPGALEELTGFLDRHEDVAAVGPMLLNGDGTLQRSWFNFPSVLKTFCHITGISPLVYRLARFDRIGRCLSRYGRPPAFLMTTVTEPMQADYLLLACLLVKRELFARIGLLDENLFFYHEDCELGYRARKERLNIWYLPEARIVHLGGSSSGKYPLATYRAYFKSLLYVFDKHETTTKRVLLRLAVMAGMLCRSSCWFLGGCRTVRTIGVYQPTTGGKHSVPGQPAREFLRTYCAILADTLRRGGS